MPCCRTVCNFSSIPSFVCYCSLWFLFILSPLVWNKSSASWCDTTANHSQTCSCVVRVSQDKLFSKRLVFIKFTFPTTIPRSGTRPDHRCTLHKRSQTACNHSSSLFVRWPQTAGSICVCFSGFGLLLASCLFLSAPKRSNPWPMIQANVNECWSWFAFGYQLSGVRWMLE